MSASVSPEVRRQVIDLLNEATSAEYNSLIGHALISNPYVTKGWENDLTALAEIREEEDASTRALLVHLGRYRAGPTLKAFRFWKEDLNFLGLDYLVIRCAENAKDEVARVEALMERLPADDAELEATFRSVLDMKKRHLERLEKMAAARATERDALRAAALKVTAVRMKKPAPAKKPGAAKPAAGAPKMPSPPLPPGAPKPPSPPLPPGAPKPPSPPLPPGAKVPSGPPKPPSPPLPPGTKVPSSPPKPPGPPQPPAGSDDEPEKKSSHPPLPPGFKMPPKPGE